MNNESTFELKSRYLELKRFLSSISDISYSFSSLREEAKRSGASLDAQVKEMDALVRQASALITMNNEHETTR